MTRPTKAELLEALYDATAHLAGAASAYRKFVGRHNRRGYRDALFSTRIKDFDNAVERCRAVIKQAPKRKR